MDVNQAATFLAGSLLIGIALVIVGSVILILNNLFHKFWKPIKMIAYHNPQYQEPVLEKEENKINVAKK
jgi:hypothetical protein